MTKLFDQQMEQAVESVSYLQYQQLVDKTNQFYASYCASVPHQQLLYLAIAILRRISFKTDFQTAPDEQPDKQEPQEVTPSQLSPKQP